MATQADYDDLSGRVTKLGALTGSQALPLLQEAAQTEDSAIAAATTYDSGSWFTSVPGDTGRTKHRDEIAVGINDASAAPDSVFDHARLVRLTTEAMSDAVAVDDATGQLTVDLYGGIGEAIANALTLGLLSTELAGVEKDLGGTGGNTRGGTDAFDPGAGGIPTPGVPKWLLDLWHQIEKYVKWIAIGLGVLIIGGVVLYIMR